MRRGSGSMYERVEQRVLSDGTPFKFVRLKSGRILSFWDALSAADRATTALHTAVARAIKLATGDDWDLERVESMLDNMDTWVQSIRAEVEKLRGIKTKEERIALLRNTSGRTPEEAAEFHRKADELERRLKEQR